MPHAKIRGQQQVYQDLHSSQSQALLLVHGHPFNHSMWRYQFEALADYRLIVPDLKGYGQSEYTKERIFIEDQALDLALLLDHLGIEQVHLMGLSMGGQIIVEFARLFPARVKSLIICASSPKAENTESYQNRLALADYIEQVGMAEYTDRDIKKYLHPQTPEKDPAVFEHLDQMMRTTPSAGAVAAHQGRAERRDNFPYLPQLKAPVLVIAGAEDFFFSQTEMEAVAAQIPQAHYHVIPDTGHLPNMENPVIFNERLLEFLNHFGSSV